mgnify:FL=1
MERIVFHAVLDKSLTQLPNFVNAYLQKFQLMTNANAQIIFRGMKFQKIANAQINSKFLIKLQTHAHVLLHTSDSSVDNAVLFVHKMNGGQLVNVSVKILLLESMENAR